MTKVLPDHAFETVNLESHSDPKTIKGKKLHITFLAKTVDGATVILESFIVVSLNVLHVNDVP